MLKGTTAANPVAIEYPGYGIVVIKGPFTFSLRFFCGALRLRIISLNTSNTSIWLASVAVSALIVWVESVACA